MPEYPNRNITIYTDFILLGFSGPKEWRQLLFIPFATMFLISISANIMIIYVIACHRSLHSPMYILIGTMAVVDLTSPIVFVPNMLLSLLLNWNHISLVGCLLQMFCFYFIGSFQTTVLLWMSLDRYFAICRPLHYTECMAFPVFMKFVIVPVLRNIALIISVVSLAGTLSYCRYEIDHCFCEHMALVTLACGSFNINNIVGLMAVFGIPTLDFVFITASYVKIFVSIFKSGKSSQKALSTCITHIIVLSLTLMFALTSFLSYRIQNNMSSNTRNAIASIYLLFSSCFNPIIYGIRTKEIRQQVIKLIKREKVTP